MSVVTDSRKAAEAQSRKDLNDLAKLLANLEPLVEIVDGVRNRRWADETGKRFVDTPEWCSFYVAWRKVHLSVESLCASAPLRETPPSVE